MQYTSPSPECTAAGSVGALAYQCCERGSPVSRDAINQFVVGPVPVPIDAIVHAQNTTAGAMVRCEATASLLGRFEAVRGKLDETVDRSPPVREYEGAVSSANVRGLVDGSGNLWDDDALRAAILDSRDRLDHVVGLLRRFSDIAASVDADVTWADSAELDARLTACEADMTRRLRRVTALHADTERLALLYHAIVRKKSTQFQMWNARLRRLEQQRQGTLRKA